MAERKKSAKPANVQPEEMVSSGEEMKPRKAWPLVTIAVFAVVIVVAFVVVCWWVIAAAWHTTIPMSLDGGDMPRRYGYESSDDRRFEWRDRRELWNAADVSGVVTSVNGDTIIVSGRGEQVTVKRTQDTVIRGDKEEVAVNDTVLVYGETEDDGSITAERILIRNESMMEDDGRSGHMIRKPDA